MRQYRGLTKDGKWVYGWYCEVLGYHYIIPNDASIVGVKPPDTYGIIGSIEVIPKSVGQQTGLNDKNGKEGYQGDIALCSDGEYGCVVWKDAGWYLKRTSKSHAWSEGYYSYIDLSYCVRTLEFIGDIHTTPKLLEKQ